MSKNDPLSKLSLNKRITIRGTAQNAALGAIVMTEEGTPVYINGIQEWDSYIAGRAIVITGTLRRKSLAPKVLNSNGAVSHGIDDKSYVLDNSKWKVDRPR